MKTCNQFTNVAALALFLLFGATLLAWSQGGHAAPITGIASPGQPILIDWSGQADNDATGVKILNQEVSGDNGISIELLPNNPLQNLLKPEGFVLLDNTLRVTSTNSAGKRRMRIRMDFGRYGGRAGLRDLGIRANTIRILRADRASGRWVRAVRRINEKRFADVRYLRALRADFVLGHHGFDRDKQFAWAVTDTRGDQYFTLAGLANVPVPAAWLLFVSGSGLMWLVTRKRRQSVAAL